MTRGRWMKPQLSFWSLLLLVSASLDFLPCSDDRTLHWLKFAFNPCCTRMCHLVVRVASDLFDTSIHIFSFLIISPITLSFFSPSTSSRMWWTNTLRTSAEDLGTLAVNAWTKTTRTSAEDLGTLAVNAWTKTTRTSAEELGLPDNKNSSTWSWAQRPLHRRGSCPVVTKQRFPDDFDYDDVTIGKKVLDACRRRADHSEGEGLSSCLSSSVSHDRTVKPVVCRDESHARRHEIQRQNSENEQIRTLLDRQREQILADCQAETRKHEFETDYERSIEKLNQTIESQKVRTFIVLKEKNDIDRIINFFMNRYWSKTWFFSWNSW